MASGVVEWDRMANHVSGLLPASLLARQTIFCWCGVQLQIMPHMAQFEFSRSIDTETVGYASTYGQLLYLLGRFSGH